MDTNPLCPYCEKEMRIDNIDYTDVTYKCECEGYKKEKQLCKEIKNLEKQLRLKKEDLAFHKSHSIFIQKRNELCSDIHTLDYKYDISNFDIEKLQAISQLNDIFGTKK